MFINNQQLYNSQNSDKSTVDLYHNLRTATLHRLIGVTFQGVTFDTNFWTAANANGGTQTVGGNMVLLKTNTTANGASVFISSKKARFMFACPHIYRRLGRFLDTGTVNNKRKFGVFDGTDGFFFQLDGTTFSVGKSKNGVETIVNSGNFNGKVNSWAVNTNVNAFEIHYFSARVEFYIKSYGSSENVLIHTIKPTTEPLCNTLTLPIYEANVNSGGSTTNVDMECWNVSVLRVGDVDHESVYKNISGAVTSILKYGPGHIDSVFINSSVAGTITVYDNTAASGTIIATITTPNNSAFGAVLQQIVFNNGLTIVTSAAGHDITVNYE